MLPPTLSLLVPAASGLSDATHEGFSSNPTDWILLAIYVGGALAISFLCSILEATLLSARIPNLVDRKNRGERGATILLELKQHRVDDAISAILTLNTIAHTVGATLAGAQAAVCLGSAWLGVFSGVLTLLVLVVTEIIPKTLGTVHANRLVGFVGATVSVLIKLLAPLLVVTRALTKLVSHGHKEIVSRGELAALVTMATRQGSLKRDESRLLGNVLNFKEVRVTDVMTPRTVAVTMPEKSTIADLLAETPAAVYSRIPVYGETPDEITGYVLQREVLAAAARGLPTETPLSTFVREIMFFPESVSLPDVMTRLLEERDHLAVVVDEFGGMSGLVSLEDAVETVLGVEIVDEMDRVADLRELAIRLRDDRLTRRQQNPELPEAEPEGISP